ncbi:hypothetical protein BURKHO8Y_480124 [Burkholderia sp. 8Y]|nr:hypothetical protein BURKHO8Y_480124 [Burkholderia sp. 8Y]
MAVTPEESNEKSHFGNSSSNKSPAMQGWPPVSVLWTLTEQTRSNNYLAVVLSNEPTGVRRSERINQHGMDYRLCLSDEGSISAGRARQIAHFVNRWHGRRPQFHGQQSRESLECRAPGSSSQSV